MTPAVHPRTVEAPSLVLDNSELARDYDRISATRQFQSGKPLVADLALEPGERVLDVGCGTGLLAEHIADLVAPRGACWPSIRCRCASGSLSARRARTSPSRWATPTTCMTCPIPASTSSC